MENNANRSKKFGSKKSKLSAFSVIFSGLLAGGAIAGSAVAIWNIAKNYTESAEFTKTVSGRVKVDPFAGYSEEEIHTKTKEDAEEILADTAEKLSRWLKDQGQKSYDVSYEVYEDEEDKDPDVVGKWYGFLNAQFDVDKVQRKHPTSEEEEDEKIDNDPYLTFFNAKAFNTNEKTLVYRWWVQNPEEGKITRPKYSFVPFRDIFAIPNKAGGKSDKSKVLVDKDGNNGVVYKIEDNAILNDIFLDLAKAKKYSEEEEKNKTIDNCYQPRLYIVNNINSLFNETNYHIANWIANKDNQSYRDLYDGTAYANIADQYQNKEINGDARKSQSEIDSHNKLDSVDIWVKGAESTDKQINGDVFNYVDQGTPGTIDADWSFTNKYITKVVTMNDYETSMPKEITDDYKNDIDVESEKAKINYFWYQQPTKNDAEKFLNNEINYGFNKASIVNFDFSDVATGETGARALYDNFTKQRFRATDIAPAFTESIFGGSHLVGTLSIGFLAFLVALLIILAVLYRTTGVMSWITMMFALAMTLLIATIGSTAISLSLIFGLFAVSIAGFMACLVICGIMKRRLNSREDTQLMINKTFRKSLLPITDISIIVLIFGICFTYIAPISLNPLGLALIIGAFAIFISIFLLNGLIHGLFFNNRIMINRYSFFGKPTNLANEALAQSNMAVPSSMDATKLEFAYYSVMSKKKLDATSKKALIAVAVVGVLLIAAIIVFAVMGWKSSSMFHTSNCLAIMTDEDVINNGWIDGLNYVSYRHDTVSGWWYFYTNADNLEAIAQQVIDKSHGVISWESSLLIQNIFGSTNQDILNFALVSVMVAAACSSIYIGIRNNWISLVPMLVGAFGIPMLVLGISAAAQVKFDQFIVLGFVFVVVVNALFCASIINNINQAWSRKDAYNKVEFKYIVNVALTNTWTFIWNVAAAYLLFVVAFGITAPLGLSSAIVLMIIGFAVTMFVAPFTMAFLVYQFMKVRNATLNKLVEKNKNKVAINYDEIDEQGIEGINKFTKKIPVAKEQPKGE